MANITPTQLVPSQTLAGVATTIYTVPNNATVKISRAVFCNPSVNPINITVGIVAVGGSLVATNTLISALTLSPNQSYVSAEISGCVMPSGSMIIAYASTATSIVTNISGLVIQ